MKKLLVIGIVMVMALSATAAMAAIDNDWLVNFKASTDAAAKVGASAAIFGLKTTAGDTFTPLGTPAALGGTPEVNYADSTHPYTTNYGVTAGRTYVAKKGGAPLGTTGTMDWTFKLAGLKGNTVYLTSWNATGGPNAIDTGTTQIIKLYESNLAGEKVGEAVWTFTPGTTATWAAATGIGGVANTNYFSKSYTLTDDNDTAGGSYKYFMLEATVPEPGSMVALFSGLVGLVGFGIRRRK